jgi:predicted DNA-binding transcriptional regulator AlpA
MKPASNLELPDAEANAGLKKVQPLTVPHVDEMLYDTAHAAAKLSLSPRTLEKMRLNGTGPRFFKLGRRRVAYSDETIREWLSSRLRRSTSDPGKPDIQDGIPG